ncbi:MAG: regulatory protein RecX [Lachnospiraceae bacterium]|nr:regulatory protein RecX [Lachnospiraceae bacterium]
MTLSEETILKIRKDCVRHHAVRKAMSLLKTMDRTEKELTDRLRREGFPEDAVMEALAYVMSYGYVDDASYADRYVYSQKEKMSLRTIRQKLLLKGIAADVIETAISENEVSEDDALEKAIVKKTHGVLPEEPKEKQKLVRYLLSKGFPYGQVARALSVEEE